MERNLAGARDPRQMPRYLIFYACAAISIALALQARGTSESRLSRETAILGFGTGSCGPLELGGQTFGSDNRATVWNSYQLGDQIFTNFNRNPRHNGW
jgi:hypothetical protein